MKPSLSRILAGVTASALGFCATGVSAQEIDESAELDRLSAAGESSESALATASAQEGDGDLLGAASTLERALLHRPEADDVRLAFATLLCRLDDLQSARIEVSVLRLRPTGGDAWQQMLQACGEDFGQISRRTGRISGVISAGLSYQEDAFGEISAFSFAPPPSRDGMAIVASAQINARVPAGGAFFYSDLFAQGHSDVSGPNSDYQIGDLAAGFGTENGKSEFSAGGLIRHGRIDGDDYFTAYGGEAGASFRMGGNGRIALRGEIVKEDYEGVDLDGWHYSALVSYQFFPTLEHSYTISAGFETKDAEFDIYGYDAFSIAGVAKMPVGGSGAYGKLSASLRHLNYHNVEFFDDSKETRFYGRGAIGLPLVKRRLYLEGGISYRSRDYSLVFAQDYSSLGGDLKLVWNF